MKFGIKPFFIWCACLCMFSLTDAYVSPAHMRGMQLARQKTCKAQNMCRPRIDYGAGYDPKNRPGRSESAVDILQRTHDMTMATRKYEDKTVPKTPPRGIDYGAGYDPKNRPSEYQHVQTHKHNSTLSHGVIVLKLFIESYENAQM